jgi:hypothetical protein
VSTAQERQRERAQVREEVLKEIEKLLREYPALRVMQLLGNCIDYDPYYLTDKELLELLRGYPAKLDEARARGPS